MKLLLILGLTLTQFSFTCFSNGLDKLEVWGWTGEKEEFRDLYLEKTGVDLTKSYACAVELSKMGYKNALSIIYPDDIQAFLAGKINWETTDRLVIVRKFPATRFTEMLKDTALQNYIGQLIYKVEINPDLLNEQSEIDEFSNFELLLLGTTTPFNNSLRDNCNTLIRNIEGNNIDFHSNSTELLAAMLSTPDPVTCYNAMSIIENYKDRQYNTSFFNLYKALTLKEFLASNLQSFQSDAVNFFINLFPERDNWSVKQWKEWLESETYE